MGFMDLARVQEKWGAGETCDSGRPVNQGDLYLAGDSADCFFVVVLDGFLNKGFLKVKGLPLLLALSLTLYPSLFLFSLLLLSLSSPLFLNVSGRDAT